MAAPPPSVVATNPPLEAFCREFTTQIVIDGQPQTAHGQACPQPDGTWAVTEEAPGQPPQSYVAQQPPPLPAYYASYPYPYPYDYLYPGYDAFYGGGFFFGGDGDGDRGFRHDHDGDRGGFRGGEGRGGGGGHGGGGGGGHGGGGGGGHR